MPVSFSAIAPGIAGGWACDHAANELLALLRWRAFAFHELGPQTIGIEIRRRPGAMREQLFERDLAPRGVDLLDVVTQHHRRRGVPRERAIVDERGHDGRGDRFAAGANVPFVVECREIGSAPLANAADAACDDGVAVKHHDRHGGKIVLLQDRREHRGDVFWCRGR
jgi:hypothetical protein